MKDKFVVRKQKCGHWGIWFITDIFDMYAAAEIAHLETFGDVLVFLNVTEMANGEY